MVNHVLTRQVDISSRERSNFPARIAGPRYVCPPCGAGFCNARTDPMVRWSPRAVCRLAYAWQRVSVDEWPHHQPDPPRSGGQTRWRRHHDRSAELRGRCKRPVVRLDGPRTGAMLALPAAAAENQSAALASAGFQCNRIRSGHAMDKLWRLMVSIAETVLAWLQAWDALRTFAGELRGSGIWIVAIPLCLALAFLSRFGVIGAASGSPRYIRRYSLVVVAGMVIVLAVSYVVGDSILLSVIVPTIVLSFFMGGLRSAVEKPAVVAPAQ